jgi:hypothetical protein
MLSRLLSLLLATTVFVCPFVCRAGEAVALPGEKADVCPCCCHEGDQESDGPDEKPISDCQCVCGGAVVDHAAANHYDFDLQESATLIVVDLQTSSQASAKSISERAEREPLEGMNCGRAMRCLFETFLC